MKRALFLLIGITYLGSSAGCLSEGGGGGTASGGKTGSGGSTSGSGGSTTGSGGATTGSGGATTGSGGATTGSGGATTGSGGATTGSGGDGSGGVTTGSGGATTGSGGATGGGTTTGSGGGTPMGGSTSMGGNKGSGGTGPGGAMGSGGSGGPITIDELFPKGTNIGSLHGRLMVVPCGEANTQGTDCVNGGGYYSTAGDTTTTRLACSGGAFTANQVFPVGGEAGKTYKATIHVWGISEPKDYGSGVTREATGQPGLQDTGSMPTPWATAKGGHTYPDSDYNTLEIRVCKTRACATADETDVYYLNADTSQGHWTFVLNFEKQITVVGGGAVRFKQYDRNCKQIKNCGANGTPNSMCAQVAMNRVVNISSATLKPASGPAAGGGLLQPNLVSERQATDSGQWVLLNVTKVE